MAIKKWFLAHKAVTLPLEHLFEPMSTPSQGEDGDSGSEREALLSRYSDRLIINPSLNRPLVSYGSNKYAAFYGWLKFKEAFSAAFVTMMLHRFAPTMGHRFTILDPFAGSGTTLTSAFEAGAESTGIEVLPVSTAAIRAGLTARQIFAEPFFEWLGRLRQEDLANAYPEPADSFAHLRITAGAFPPSTERELAAYQAFIRKIPDEKIRYLFWFAGLSVLEQVSYTRKDGQYLRWDSRADRRLRASFHKGHIPGFQEAVVGRLESIHYDIKGHNGAANNHTGLVNVIEGSCLFELPKLPNDQFDLVITSPPYCNRYDYTRTYALELAYIGCSETQLKQLRQTLLSATVENHSKKAEISEYYAKIGRHYDYDSALVPFERQLALQEILEILRQAARNRELNNSKIPEMVENYFFEMNFVIRELARVTKNGGRVVMVNDNVQYHGEEVPVDLILADFAEMAGFEVETIWVLPIGKGNSSQQMGKHGRRELRKCVYVWRKK